MTKLLIVIKKNFIYRKRRWIRTLLQILIPIVLFLSFAFIRSKIDNLEKKINHEAFYNTEYSSEHLYNDRFDHETKIYYTPCNEFTSEIMYRVQVKFYLNIESFKCYETQQELLNHVEYNDVSIMAILFMNLTSEVIPKQLSYQIRPFQKYIRWDTGMLYRSASTYTPDLGSSKYLYHGLLAVQMALETSYIEIITKNDLPVTVQLQEFPYPPHTDKSGTMDMLNYILPLATILSFTFSCGVFLPRIIEDKSSGMKEFLKINGVKSWMIYFGWFVDELGMNCIITISITVFLKVPLFTVETPPIENCDVLLLLVFLMLYSISAISFCLALSSLFNKCTYVVSVALITWILSYIIPYIRISSNTLSSEIIYGLFPNGLLIYGFKILSVYEARGVKASWSNIFEAPCGGYSDIRMGIILIMFAVISSIYFGFALGVEYFSPGPYGVPRWKFPFSINLCRRQTTKQQKPQLQEHECTILIQEHSSSMGELNRMEEIKETCDLPVSVHIRNLTKVFGSKTAVNNVSLDIYDEQITVLLGKNGAGKTTMLSMLTGMVNPTNGSITFTQGDKVTISFCPQHNLHFTSLNVMEHLQFFGKLRGLSGTDSIENSKKLLELTNLTDKKNELLCNLSEGMRRKLSLAIAVTGNSNIVILDEPSTGLDPEVRRDIWNFIITLRGFRTLIITTHLMEEAEALSDRIIIINDGCVLDYGSPLYLSKKYGVGYKIHVNLKSKAEPSKIKNTTKDYNTKFVTNSNVDILFDKSEKNEFVKLLGELEGEKEELEIHYVNFSQTTLEDVFLNAINTTASIKSENFTNSNQRELPKKQPKNICQKKYWVLLKKWIKLTPWKIHLFQALMLVISMMVIFFLGESMDQFSSDENLLELNLRRYGKTQVFYSTNDTKDLYKSIPKIYTDLVKFEFSEVQKVVDVNEAIIQEGRTNIEFYKKYMVVAAEFLTIKGHNIAKAMYSNNAVHASPISLTLLLNTILKTLAGTQYSISSEINPLPCQTENKVGHMYSLQIISIWGVLLPITMVLISSLFIVIPQNETVSKLKQLQLMCGVSWKQYWSTCYLWNSIVYTLIIVSALLLTYLINSLFHISKIFAANEIITLLLILFVYGIAVLPYIYLYTFRVSTMNTLGIFIILNLFISYMLMIFVLYLENSNDDCMENASKIFRNLLTLFPVFGLQQIIDQFVKKSVWNYNWLHTSNEHRDAICRSSYNPCCDNDEQKCSKYQWYLSFEDPTIITGILITLGSTILYITILILIEMKVCRRKKFKTGPTLKVTNLSKKFGGKQAVNDVSFNTPKNECLGLLGGNGAGKTTITRLLSNEEMYDSGEIERSTKNFGYCPQIDCATSLASGKSILELFGNLRGVHDVKGEVDRLIKAFDLKDADTVCSKYSGGNKRKLGTAIAVIGNPSLIVLDEPTAGVDPVSRQKMRKELTVTKEKSSMIVSTHILEDCETLCNKVAILKKGKIIEEGSISELKNKTNQTVTVRLKINDTVPLSTGSKIKKRLKIVKEMQEWNTEESKYVKSLKEAFKDNFENSDLQDQHASLLKYNLTIANMHYNDIFKKVEQLQKHHSIIEDYEIRTSRLEDVYLEIVNQT